jgi:hypothetical protein
MFLLLRLEQQEDIETYLLNPFSWYFGQMAFWHVGQKLLPGTCFTVWLITVLLLLVY